MAYVILHASGSYSPFDNQEACALALIAQWGDQLVQSNTVTPHRVHTVRLRDLGLDGNPARLAPEQLREEIVERTLVGFRRAAEAAGPRGQVAVAFGHGLTGRWFAWVDLAPIGVLRVDLRMVERLGAIHDRLGSRALDPDSVPELTYFERAFLAIGAILRGNGARERVSCVDLLTCSVGTNVGGQRLLDWLHVLWGVPVRGLRGPLAFEGRCWAGLADMGEPVTATVMPPPGIAPRRRSGYGVSFSTSTIDQDRLWQRSRGTRPSHVDGNNYY